MWIWSEFACFDCAPNRRRRPRRKGHVPRLFMVVYLLVLETLSTVFTIVSGRRSGCVQGKKRILYNIYRVVRIFYITFIFISYTTYLLLRMLLLLCISLSILAAIIRLYPHPHPPSPLEHLRSRPSEIHPDNRRLNVYTYNIQIINNNNTIRHTVSASYARETATFDSGDGS